MRLARTAKPCTQRALAARSGIAQPNIASLESESGRDATVDTVDRLVRAAGARLTVLPTRSSTVAEVAADVADRLADDQPDRAYRAVIGLHDTLHNAEPALRVALAVTRPASVGDRRWDALIAAVTEHNLKRLPLPIWIREPERVADGWFVDDVPALADRIRLHTPPAFRRHGIWLDEAELASV